MFPSARNDGMHLGRSLSVAVPLRDQASAWPSWETRPCEQEPGGVCMGLFRTFASKMPLVQAQLDNPNRPAVPAQFGQPFGQDLDKLQKRPETMSLTSSFMVGVARFELATSSVSADSIHPMASVCFGKFCLSCLVDGTFPHATLSILVSYVQQFSGLSSGLLVASLGLQGQSGKEHPP